MANYIKSKIQQVISFPLVRAIVVTTFYRGLLVNTNPSYADNPDDTQKAKQGVKDLIGADLTGVDLTGAHLRRANLRAANLRETHLTGVNLQAANL